MWTIIVTGLVILTIIAFIINPKETVEQLIVGVRNALIGFGLIAIGFAILAILFG